MSGKNEKVWRKMRFKWNAGLMGDPSLNTGSKNLAVLLGEKYANNHTGVFWPSNAELATATANCTRTTQRHLNKLVEMSWLRRVNVKGRRRGFQVWFPEGAEHDTKRDKLDATLDGKRVTRMTRKGDRDVVPYLEPIYEPNQEPGMKAQRTLGLSFLIVAEDDGMSHEQWKAFILDHTNYPINELQDYLRKGAGYAFPSRFPEELEEAIDSYIAFFDVVYRSKGKCLE